MIPSSFHAFFAAVAGASAALIGLLFVEVSIARSEIFGSRASVTNQVGATSSLTALVPPLLVSLVALIPGAKIGVTLTVVGTLGVLFVISAVPPIVRSTHRWGRLRALSAILGFLAVMVLDVVYGVGMIADARSGQSLSVIAAAVIVSLAIGIERA